MGDVGRNGNWFDSFGSSSATTPLLPMDISSLLSRKYEKPVYASESEYEDYILENLDQIIEGAGLPPILSVDRQRSVLSGGYCARPDIFIVHEDHTATVIEVKCVGSRKGSYFDASSQVAAIGQLLLYGTMIEQRKGVRPRLMLIDNRIHPQTYLTITSCNLPVMIVEVDQDRVVGYRVNT